MAGSAIGGIVGGVFAGKGAEKQAEATRYAADMADPFRGQRGFYQNILRNVYGGMGGGGPAYGGGAFGAGKGGGLVAQVAGRGAGAQAPTTGGGIEEFIRSSPDYQFRLAEGQRAIERSAAGRGMLKSGNLLRELVSFGQGTAASAYESEINRIMTMAGATVGSPGVAGQIASQAAAIEGRGREQMLGGIGYGIGQIAQNWGQSVFNPASQAGSIFQQTGYTGGAAGVLSGEEWASWD